MATDVQPDSEKSESGVVELLRGIFEDLRELLKQQFALVKHEFRRDLVRMATAAGLLVAGVGLALGGIGLLLLMAVHLLSAVLNIPLWGGYGIVGIGVILLGAILFWIGRRRLTAAALLPAESVRALMENLECLTRPK